MTIDYLQIIFLLEAVIFLTIVFMHLVHKNSSAISLYAFQSLIVSVLMFGSAFKESSWLLAFVAILMFVVKVLVAPYFFQKLVRSNQLKFSSSTYLNSPLTLVMVAALTGLTYSSYFSPLTILAEKNQNALLLSVAMILVSVFLIINRKGILSQMIGILSLENAIVSFAFLSGLEAAPSMQLGIIFDILVWVIIASVFATMIYKKFGTLDSTTMKNLKEE